MKSSLLLGTAMSVLLAACSQPPAKITHKGNQYFGRDASSSLLAKSTPPRVDNEPIEVAAAAPTDVIVAMDVPEIQVMPAATMQLEMKTASFVAPDVAATPSVIKPAPQEQLAELQELAPLEPEPEPVKSVATFKPVPAPASLEAVVQTASFVQPAFDAASPRFIWPVEGKVTSRFGPKKNGLINDGMNISATEGAPIWAAAGGTVAYAGNELKGYGNMVIVRHDDGWMSAYAHASDMLVTKGDRVNQGDLIGYVGKTGAVKTAQLHFSVREGKNAVDPQTLLPQRVASAN